jgi:NADH-quinone oxidoreductase subunit F
VAFSPADRRRAEQIAGRYPHSKSATLPLLHLVQERDGWVTTQGIEDVAEFLGLTPALVLGTCSFYTMFKLAPVGKLVVSVCTNIACLVNGGPDLFEHVRRHYVGDADVVVEEGGVPGRVRSRAGAPGELRLPRTAHGRCRSRAHRALPVGRAHGAHDLGHARRGPRLMAQEAVRETPMVTKFLRERPDDSWQYDVARAYNGAYTRLERALSMEPEAIVEEVQKSGLRGKGGAGFGAGQKWSFLPKDVFPRYLCVNGDEGEPATFKDHMLVERDPHQLIEGVIITAYAIRANHAFIYLRGEFALGAERLQAALDDAYAHGYIGRNIGGTGSTSKWCCTVARAATSPVTRRACCRASRVSARCRASSRRSPRHRASMPRRRW